MLLADFGAEVIKVEQPGLGDDTRHWSPPAAGEMSAYFISANRNKRSLTLNLKHPEGQKIARALAEKADVVVENFKVGGMANYGLSYADLRPSNPGLIYCSITGYGQDSPWAERPGYDYVIQGQSGLMSVTGPSDGEPYKVGVAIADVFAGLFAANSILTALLHRERSGEGQAIDIALLDSQIAAMVNVASNYLVGGQIPPRLGNTHPNIVPYQTFQASDGPFILAVGNDRQFRAVCGLIGRPDLAIHPHFSSNPQRVRHREELTTLLSPYFLERPMEDWVEDLLAVDVPAGEIYTLDRALRNPHARARGLVETVSLADGTMTEILAPTAKLSATPASIHHPPPALGQDTEAVLKEWLDIDLRAISEYRAAQII
jgi:crotonobetainyl-CoA:carnitine CoA-transferase CaiB-like acyl-CoA transferase